MHALKERRYLLRRAERNGLQVTFETAAPANFERSFATLVELHHERWKGAGMLDDELEQFHHTGAGAWRTSTGPS